MATQEKKARILELLKQQQQPLSLPKLIQALGSDYSERSLRRWLNQMAEENLILKTGHKRGTRYQAVDTAKKILPSIDRQASLFSHSSQRIIESVRKPIFTRSPVTYNAAWLNNYKPNKDFYLSKHQRNELFSCGQRASLIDPAGTFARRIYNRLLIDLSYNSSRLEGNTYSLIETEKLLLEGITAADKLDTERVMILNHREAIRHLVETSHRLAITMDEICTLHYLLSDGLVPAHNAGKLRHEAVRVGGSTYAPMEDKNRLQRQLKIICDKAAAIEHPIEQSIFLLVHIAYLQAFTDVNKRTSRLSANIPLITHNLVPLSFNEINQDDYSSAMIAVYELNETNPLVDLYSWCYLRSCKHYNVTAEAIGLDIVRVRYRNERRIVLAHIIIHKLIGKSATRYINTTAKTSISLADRAEFIEDALEDLEEIGPERIIGLGITPKQLNQWLKLNAKHN